MYNDILHVCLCTADHLAVSLYLTEKVSGLTLHLPACWHQDDTNPHFDDNGSHNVYNNPGRSANRLHKQFSGKIEEDSLRHLLSAKYVGATYKVHKGFKERNTAVAKDSKYLVAFTWNGGNSPKKGSGTMDTWNKHTGEKIHISIASLLPTESKLDSKPIVDKPECTDFIGIAGLPDNEGTCVEESCNDSGCWSLPQSVEEKSVSEMANLKESVVQIDLIANRQSKSVSEVKDTKESRAETDLIANRHESEVTDTESVAETDLMCDRHDSISKQLHSSCIYSGTIKKQKL